MSLSIEQLIVAGLAVIYYEDNRWEKKKCWAKSSLRKRELLPHTNIMEELKCGPDTGIIT